MKLHNAFPTRHGRMTVKLARLVALATTSVVVLLPHGALAQQAEWSKLPRMQLERQFAGPLQDTVVQRWRDPADGTVCYMYLPISAPHSPPTPSGYVQYGSATIGSISCMPGAPAPAAQKR